MFGRGIICGTFILWLLLAATTGSAQVTTATISGTVKDSTGAVLPGAKVVLLNEETGISRTVQADAAGRYSAPSLSLGNYRVTATLEGFQTEVRRGIVLTVGREAVVDLALSVGAVAQTLEVTGEAPLVESTSSSLGSLVDDRTIRALPLNGRSYDQLALLQPGVVQTAPGKAVGSFAYGQGKRFSVGGSRANANSFLLDGTDINDQANATPGGAAGTNLGVDTIREFKILTNSFSAEYGRADGAVVTAVTRSGTNEFHGGIFEYLRNSALDARNFFDVGSTPPFKRNQFGGVFGGPIKKDKTFFFGGYEGLRQGLGSTLIATVPTLLAKRGILPTGTVPVNPVVVPFLNLWPAPNGRDFGDGTAEFLASPTIVTSEDNYMVRVDHQLNQKTSIFGRYTFDEDSANTPDRIPTFATASTSRRQYSTLQVNSILSPKALSNFRFAYNRSFQQDDIVSTVPLGPEFSFLPGMPIGLIQMGSGAGNIRPITTLGVTQSTPRSWNMNVFQWADDVSYITGKHSLKTGVNIERIRDNSALNSNVRGSYTFTTFNDLLAGTPATLAAVPPGQNSYRGYRQTIYGVYVQDEITVNSRLTLNLGLRWEAITDPTEAHGKSSTLFSPSDSQVTVTKTLFSVGKKNFEPRVGLAWRLNDSGKTVLRVGGGIYHNPILPAIYANPSSVLPPFLTNLQVSKPTFPNGLQALAAAGGQAKPRIKAFAPVNKIPVSDQYNLSIEQQFFKDTVVQIAFAGRKSNHLSMLRETNTPIPTILADGSKFFPLGAPRANPNFDSIETYTTATNAVYNSLTISIKQRSATGLQYQAFYTFSKAMDQMTGLGNSESARSSSTPLDPTDVNRDWGLSDNDARHNFVYSLTYPLPFRFDSKPAAAALGGWSVTSIGTFQQGRPLTPRLAVNNSRNLDINAPDRPNLRPGASNNPVLGGPDNYFDASVFSLPLPGTYGNLGRNTVSGPGFANVDLMLEKNFKIRETVTAAFRAEVFNIFNHANFDLPNVLALTAGGAPSASAGRVVDTLTSSRQIQFALRINF
jgi:carboxypeptidase family protein/TonB-dependent receptor-like protein